MNVEPVYSRDAVAPADQEAFDRVQRRQQSLTYEERSPEEAVGPYFGVLMQAPRIADLLSALGMYMRSRGEVGSSFTHADREWVDMVLGHELSCNGVTYSHLLDAVSVGVRPEAIKALRDHRDDDLTPAERQLADFIRAVSRGQVTESQYREIEERFGTRGAVDYTVCINWLGLTMRNLQAFGFGSPSDAMVDDLLASVLAGTAEIPDSTARVATPDAAAI